MTTLSLDSLATSLAIEQMDSTTLYAYAAALKARADRQSVEIEVDEVRVIVDKAWVSPSAERSPFAEIIRVRVALRRLIEGGLYHPDQLRCSFLTVALERSTHPAVAGAAVELAIRDGLSNRERPEVEAEGQ
jgi:hypothetical protein